METVGRHAASLEVEDELVHDLRARTLLIAHDQQLLRTRVAKLQAQTAALRCCVSRLEGDRVRIEATQMLHNMTALIETKSKLLKAALHGLDEHGDEWTFAVDENDEDEALELRELARDLQTSPENLICVWHISRGGYIRYDGRVRGTDDMLLLLEKAKQMFAFDDRAARDHFNVEELAAANYVLELYSELVQARCLQATPK